jgi:hypothetical protein
MPLVPNSNLPGYLFVSSGTGQNAGYWIPLTDSKEYVVQGVLAVASGGTNYIGPHIVPVNGQLLSVTGLVRAGSLTLDIKQNGSGITGLTSLAFNTTVATFTPTNTTLVSAGDTMQPVIDAVSSADNLTLSFVYWVYLS